MSDQALSPYEKIAVLGAGAWGTALAALAARAGRDVMLWGRDAEVIGGINEQQENPRYLPGIALPNGLAATTSLSEAVSDADAILLVTPSSTLTNVCTQLSPALPQNVPIALCCKGIDTTSGRLLHDVAHELLPTHPIGALSGPTFAAEAARGLPTAVTIAFEDIPGDPAARLALSLGSESFRPYISHDLSGVEVCGAVKNVIAIACGMMAGAGFGENTRAALVTRGLDEIRRLSLALGGRIETVMGLAGIGDLSLTCASPTSRNMGLGLQLGQGIPRAECFDGRPVVVEGEVNAVSVRQIAQRAGVEMPIAEAVHAILHEGADLAETFATLWARPLRHEASDTTSLPHPTDARAVQEFAEKLR
ncbi:MAG: NAD(P)H-dependent glycerol-3-phosphate dehydrogenase [Pseudomonadota bacterium]